MFPCLICCQRSGLKRVWAIVIYRLHCNTCAKYNRTRLWLLFLSPATFRMTVTQKTHPIVKPIWENYTAIIRKYFVYCNNSWIALSYLCRDIGLFNLFRYGNVTYDYVYRYVCLDLSVKTYKIEQILIICVWCGEFSGFNGFWFVYIDKIKWTVNIPSWSILWIRFSLLDLPSYQMYVRERKRFTCSRSGCQI